MVNYNLFMVLCLKLMLFRLFGSPPCGIKSFESKMMLKKSQHEQEKLDGKPNNFLLSVRLSICVLHYGIDAKCVFVSVVAVVIGLGGSRGLPCLSKLLS